MAAGSSGETTMVSGRSNGKYNMQTLMEKLGGGGHQSAAGVQLPESLHSAQKELTDAIHSYIAEQADDSENK